MMDAAGFCGISNQHQTTQLHIPEDSGINKTLSPHNKNTELPHFYISTFEKLIFYYYD
jgi:hypothetical protein